jgi:hypothetical protein
VPAPVSGTGLPSILAFPLSDTVNDEPNGEISTQSSELLEAHPAALSRGSKGPGNGKLKEPCP